MRSVLIFCLAIAPFGSGFAALSTDERCAQDLLNQLSRFALEQVQRPDLPSSTRAGLREDLEEKLHMLAERSGTPIAEMRRQLLEAKRRTLFFARSGARGDGDVALREELAQLPGKFELESRLFEMRGSGLVPIAVSSDGDRIAAGDGETVRVWDLRQKIELPDLFGHAAPVSALAFSPDGTHLASGSNDSTIQIWDLRDGKVAETRFFKNRWTDQLVFSPDGQTLFGGTVRGDIAVWKPGATHPVFLEPKGAFAFGNGGKFAVAHGGELWLWEGIRPDPDLGDQVTKIHSKLLAKSKEHNIVAITVSPDGKQIAAALAEGMLGLWDEGRGQMKFWRSYPTDWALSKIHSVAFSSDGARLLSAGNYGARIWNTSDLKLSAESPEDQDHLSAALFTPDGERILAGGYAFVLLKRIEAGFEHGRGE